MTREVKFKKMNKNSKTKYLMIQGTGSHVGKSVIVSALCRIFANQGLRVAPFKAQNMALNSFITAEGGEVGRSTAVQAKAARAILQVEMNPVLLKPKGEKEAQFILNGRAHADISAFDQFHQNKILRDMKWEAIREGLAALSQDYERIVIEGAGSPAEVNLRAFDLVNMEVARHCGAPVLLVTDIDKGGSLASIVGTLELLTEEERAQVKGFIFNKFRGDKRLFDPAIDFLKNKTGLPTLGLVPFDPTLALMEEDALRELAPTNGDPEIDIAVVAHRHLSNFTDFDPLLIEAGVQVRFVRTPAQLGKPDAIILPGSKNTMNDLQHLYDTGLAGRIQKLAEEGLPIVGICGGYQMMGKELFDPDKVESKQGVLEGLGLLDVVTEFQVEKITRQVRLRASGQPPFFSDAEEEVEGYEIHCGATRSVASIGNPAFFGTLLEEEEGCVDAGGLIFGTALHGLFENDAFRRRFVNVLRVRKNLLPIPEPLLSFHEIEDEQIERWAAFAGGHLDLETIEALLDQ